MDRYDIFVKQPPSMRVEEGMFQLDFYSGEKVFGCVMSASTFARHLADAQKLYALWSATQQDVVVPMRETGLRPNKRRRKDHTSSD